MTAGDVGAPALEVRGLSKSYRVGHIREKLRPVLKDLELTVPRGEVFGYLGPNGSGKTTTLKVLMGLLRPDAGTATVLGHALADRAWRYRTGYLPENPYLYDYLTAREYLEYVGRLFGMDAGARASRARDLLELVGMTASADVALRRVSKGMLQRVALAQALMNDPDLLILDEPMSGLDPIGRHMVRRLIRGLKDKGKTIFFSTHILSDAENLCDRVALLRGGAVVAAGALSEILTLDASQLEVLVSGLDAEQVRRLGQKVAARSLGERWHLEVPSDVLADVVLATSQAGGRVLSVQPIRESLEEFFVREMAPAGGDGTWEG